MSKSRILSKLIIPIALLTIYSITLYKTATAPLEPDLTVGTETQTTSTQALVEEENTDDIPRPPKAPPAPTAALNSPEILRFVALTDPRMVPATQVNWLELNDLVLGIVHDGEAQAFPLTQLALHHVINVRIAGDSFVITYCMLCGGQAASYKAMFGNTRLTFDIFGVDQDGLSIIDRQTRSLWGASNGNIINGPLLSEMRMLPPHIITLAAWKDWLSLHPQTTVLPLLPEYTTQYSKINLNSPDPVVQVMDNIYTDKRLSQEEVVLGISIDNQYLTYRIPELNQNYTVINDSVNGVPIVIFFDNFKSLGAAYSARIEDQTMIFSLKNGRITSTDGSKWNVEGQATTGPSHGKELSPIASQLIQWGIWSAYHPETSIRDQ